MSEMKYYIGKIQERRGEFRNNESIMFWTDEDPHEFLEVIAYEWYDLNENMDALLNDPESAEEFFEEYEANEEWMGNEFMIYGAGDHEEVPEDIYDFLLDKRIFVNVQINKGNSVANWVKLKEMYL